MDSKASEGAPLSVVIPCYNEVASIHEIVDRVAASPLVHEIIVVDDYSTDGTRDALAAIARKWPSGRPPLRIFHQPFNRGKGAALREGFRRVTGRLTIVQDADLEYDPKDYAWLVEPILAGHADVVYGSRFAGFPRRVLYFWHAMGNRMLTMLSNMATNLHLTDMETCYKVFVSDIIRDLPLRSDRFGFEPEVTAKIAKLGCRVYEVPISYHERGYKEGKKIGWKDAIQAIAIILKYWFLDDLEQSTGKMVMRMLQKASRHNEWCGDILKPYLGMKILEVGAGIGNMTGYLAAHGRVTASDISPAYLRELSRLFTGRRNVTVRRLDINEDPGPDAARHDTVVCINLLEHMENEAGALRNVRSYLRPGGRALVLVPANGRLFCEIDRRLGHFRRYTKEELIRKLTTAGFRVTHARYHNLLGAIAWWWSGKVLRRNSLSSMEVRGFSLLMPLVRLLDRIESRFSLSVFAVAERPPE